LEIVTMTMSPEYAAELEERRTRPFRFEDLPLTNGKRIEPEEWGPKYSKPAKPGKPADRCPTNAPSGQKYDFDAAKHRSKMRAKFTAQASADRRNWAEGKPRATAWGKTETIVEAYKQAMATKRARLATCKPHYILRDGQWQIAA
jgi:hypothetical protein